MKHVYIMDDQGNIIPTWNYKSVRDMEINDIFIEEMQNQKVYMKVTKKQNMNGVTIVSVSEMYPV